MGFLALPGGARGRMNSQSRIIVMAAAGLLLACATCAAAQSPAPAPFTPGETLTYDVTWAIFPAGKVTATFLGPSANPADGDEILTKARSQGVVSLLYNVQDTFRSFFDSQTLCSRRIAKVINEGSRHKQTEIVFDYARHAAVLNEHDPTRANAPTKHAENPIPNCVEDVVTAFYYLRRQPLEAGHSVRLAVNDGSKTTEVTVEVQGLEQVQTGLGTRQAVRVEPKVFGQLFKRKGRMWIWFSDDQERLPLVIKVSLGVGTLTGKLKSVTRTPLPGERPKP
jgi:Protein of unknown function (DUF3108)